MAIISANGVDLPSPTSIKIDDELIWSSDTGRTQSAEMVGDIVGIKNKVSVEWAWLTLAEFNTISNAIRNATWFNVTVSSIGLSFTAYRGAISKELVNIGSEYRYKTATCNFTER